MEVKIGVQYASRELSFESTQTREAIVEAVQKALSSEHGLITLADERGRSVIVPAEKLAYLEMGEESSRKVGFGSL